jgi:hypothetical protein
MFEQDTMEDRLKCDIEVDCANGKAVAWVLRKLADQLEDESMDSGHHDINMPNGEKVGEIYLDYYSKGIQ